MYCRLLLKLILRDKAVWICTLVLAAAFSVPIAFNSPIYGPFFMKQGMQSFVDAFNTRAPQASGTDLSPEQQADAELARYANAALAAQTDAAFLDSAESYYALMGEGFQSGSIVGDRETNDADLAYCRALSSSGITDIPASANDLPFLSFLPYAIATAPSFLPFIPFLLSSILVLGATRPGTLAAKAPAPKFRRLIQIVFSIIGAGTAMLLAGLAPGSICALALNGFGQIGYPIAFFHDGALATTTAGDVFTTLLLALLAGGTLISVCSVVLSTATRRVLAGPLASALLVAAPAFPLLSDSALEHNAVLGLLPLAVFSPIEATGYVGCFPTEFIGSGSGSASMLSVALAYVAVFFTVGAVATRSPKQPGPAKKHHGLELLDASVGYGSTTILSIGSLFLSPGTAAGLVAPNGSGKTTTIKLMLGLLTIEKGEIFICGHDVRHNFEAAMTNVGGIIENPEMYKYLTGRQNLEQYCRMCGRIPISRIDEVVALVGLEDRIDDKISKYSLGMRQRLGLAQALLNKPALLVLDEPTNGLDPAGIHDLRETLKSLAAQGVAVFVSSHQLAELEQMCTRVGVLDRGTLLGVHTMEELHGVSEVNTSTLLIRVQNGVAAEAVMSRLGIGFKSEDGGYTVTLADGRVPEVLRELAVCDAGLLAAIPVQRSLEQAFLEMTRNYDRVTGAATGSSGAAGISSAAGADSGRA